MSSSKTRLAAANLASRFEYYLNQANISYRRQDHKTDGLAIYFTRSDFICGKDWTIRISDHDQQGNSKYKPKYYSITYRDIKRPFPALKLRQAVKLIF